MHRKARKTAALPAAGLSLLSTALGACEVQKPAVAGNHGSGCPDSGRLKGQVYGSVEGRLDWRAPDIGCEGMRRPDDAGVRLRFSGPSPINGDAGLAFIIALPELERGKLARETPSRVTLIEEDSGRFFSTANIDACWSDVTGQVQIDENVYDIRGIVYCVSPLAELNGGGGVTFTELEYAGRVDWSAPE